MSEDATTNGGPAEPATHKVQTYVPKQRPANETNNKIREAVKRASESGAGNRALRSER
jgi:hypothetical protein